MQDARARVQPLFGAVDGIAIIGDGVALPVQKAHRAAA